MRSGTGGAIFWSYIGVTAVLGLATLVLALPGAATVLVLFTFGLAAPLLTIPTLFAYALSFAPAAWAARGGTNLGGVAALGFLGIGFLAYGLPGLATAVAERQAASAAAGDMAQRRATPPRSLEIIDSAAFWNGKGDALKALPCTSLCQKLLLGGDATAVRLTGVSGLGGRKQEIAGSITYRFERRSVCPAAFERAEKVEPATKQALVEGRCIVPDHGASDAMEARIVVINRYTGPARRGQRGNASPKLSPMVEPGLERGLDIVDLAGATEKLLRRQTETNWRQIPTPFRVEWEMRMQSGDGPVLRSEKHVARKIDLEQALRETFGYRLDMDMREAPAPDAKAVETILAEPGAARLGAEKQSMVSDVMAAMAKKRALDVADLTLLRRTLADRRIDDAYGLVQVLQRHPQAAQAMVGEILAHLAIPSTDAKGHTHNGLAWALVRMPPEKLRPYRDGIAAILAADSLWGPAPLMIPLGRIGGDSSALFAERLKVERGSVAYTAAKAICAAGPALAPQMLALARETLDRAASAERKRPSRDMAAMMLRALVRHGAGDEARSRIAQLAPEPKDFDRLTRDVFGRKSAASGVKICDSSLSE